MMISLPKIQKSTGKQIMTGIDPNEIKGFDQYTMKGVKGTKVYTSSGWFFSPIPPMLLAQAKVAALQTGEIQVIEAAKMEMVVTAPAQVLSIPSKVKDPNFKKLLPGKGW